MYGDCGAAISEILFFPMPSTTARSTTEDIFHQPSTKSTTLQELGRQNLAAHSPVFNIESSGYCQRCLRQLCLGHLHDLILNAANTLASVASHTRATTTLWRDTGVVGSVTVYPRATHATKKCTCRREKHHHIRNKFVQTSVRIERVHISIH